MGWRNAGQASSRGASSRRWPGERGSSWGSPSKAAAAPASRGESPAWKRISPKVAPPPLPHSCPTSRAGSRWAKGSRHARREPYKYRHSIGKSQLRQRASPSRKGYHPSRERKYSRRTPAARARPRAHWVKSPKARAKITGALSMALSPVEHRPWDQARPQRPQRPPGG